MKVPSVIRRPTPCIPLRKLGIRSSPKAILLLAILVCASPLMAQNYKGSMTYNGPRGMTATPLVINMTISGTSITGSLSIGSTAANLPLTGTRTGDYCKVTATGAGGGVFTGTCTSASFSGTSIVGSTTGNFSLKAAYTPPPQIPPAPIPAPLPTEPVPPAPIAAPPTKPTPPAPVAAPPTKPTPPATVPAHPPIVPVPAPPPCAVATPSQPSPGAPPQVVNNPPESTPASQSILYCGTFKNTTFNVSGYLEIRVDPGTPFAGEISVGQAISGTSRGTFGSGTFTGFLSDIACGATDSGGLQFTGLCTPTTISADRYSIQGQIGSFIVTTGGCAKKQ